jgi:hypothetical protein
VLREFQSSVAKDMLLIENVGLQDIWLTLTIANDFTQQVLVILEGSRAYKWFLSQALQSTWVNK